MMTPGEMADARITKRRVVVTGHEYKFEGIIIAAFVKRDQTSFRCVVENDDGVCLIQSPKNLTFKDA